MIRKYNLPTAFFSSLDFLRKYYQTPPPPITDENGLSYTSDSYLRKLLSSDPLDVCEESKLEDIILSDAQKSILYNTLSNHYPKSSILLSGNFFYPSNGYMSWHTNNKAPGLRLYLSYTEYPGESFFIYKDGDKIIKDADDYGWTAREFKIDKENLLWHSVFCRKPRISIGFRIIKNLL